MEKISYKFLKSPFSKRLSRKLFFGGIVIAIFCFSMLLFSPVTFISSGSINGSINHSTNQNSSPNSNSNSIANSVSTTIQNSVSNLQSAATSGNSNPTGDEWTMFGCSLNHTGVTETTPIGGNKPIWNYTTSNDVYSSPAIVNGCVFVGSVDTNLYCLNETTGNKIWNYQTYGWVTSSPAVANGMVYVGSNSYYLFCLNATNGTKIWRYPTNNIIDSSPAVANGMVYVGSEDDNMYCLNASNGISIWNYTTGGAIESSPAIVNGFVFFGSDDNNTYCLNALTGKLVWNYTTGAQVLSSPAVAYGNVVFTSRDGYCYCLNAFSGSLIWKYLENDYSWVQIANPAIYNGLVFIPSCHLYCLNITNGVLVWDNLLPNVLGNIAISCGMLYFQSTNYLDCLNITNGNIIWLYYEECEFYTNPAIADGKIFIGNGNYQVQCFPMLFAPTSAPTLQLKSGDKQITLDWKTATQNGGSSITNYTIYRGTSPGNEKYLVTIGNANSYVDAGLSDNTTYYYIIQAANIYGEGPISSEISTTTDTTPSAPSNLQILVGNLTATLNWNIPKSYGGSSITSYKIYRGISTGNETLLATIGNTTTYIDSNLSNDTTYYYEISAVNAIGEGPKSIEVNITSYDPNATNSQNNSNNSKNLAPSINGMTIGEILFMNTISVISVVLISKKRFSLKNRAI